MEFSISDFENPELKEMSKLIKEYKEIEIIQKELKIRHNILKTELIKRLKEEKDQFYEDSIYQIHSKTIETKRLDIQKIKKYIEENNISIQNFQQTSTSNRLFIKRKEKSPILEI